MEEIKRNKKGQFVKGFIPWDKGIKRPPFSKKWKKQSEKIKKKISEALKGKHPTKKTRKKMSESHNGITLCKNCHKLFHKTYGIKNNTRKQLLKFLFN